MGNKGEITGIGENHRATQPSQLMMREDAAAATRRQKYWEEPAEASLKRKPVAGRRSIEAGGNQETPWHLWAPQDIGKRMGVRGA